MAITRVNAAVGTVQEGTGTTFNVPYPASTTILANDVIVLVSELNSLSAPGVPGGYTPRAADDSGGSTPMVRMYTAVAAGGESGTIAVTKPAVNGKVYIAGVYRGVDTSVVVDVNLSTTNVGYSSASAATAYTIPGFTTTVAGVAILVAGCANASTGTWTPPTVPAAFTELLDTNGSVAAVPSICYDELIWSGSGATGNIDLTRSTSIRGSAAAIALRPAVADTSAPAARRVNRASQRRRIVTEDTFRGVYSTEFPQRQSVPLRTTRNARRRLAPRTAGNFVAPPAAAQPANPALVTQRQRERVRLATSSRSRLEFVPITQAAPVAPAFVPPVISRRVLRGWLRRTIRKTEHVPAQSGQTAHFVTARRVLRGIVSRRVRRVEVVPTQAVVVAPPSYVPSASQRRTVRGWLARRAHRVEVVPAQQSAPVNPLLVPQATQRRILRGWATRRRPQRTVPAITDRLAQTVRTRARTIARRRRAPVETVPAQAVASPRLVPQATGRRVVKAFVRRITRRLFPLGQSTTTIATPINFIATVLPDPWAVEVEPDPYATTVQPDQIFVAALAEPFAVTLNPDPWSAHVDP